MLNCKFCNKIPSESTTHDLSLETQKHINKNNLKYFVCNCDMKWLEVDSNKELFNLNLFNKEIKTFNDFKELISILNKETSHDNTVEIIKDCLHRINDRLTSEENIEKPIDDTYIKKQIDILSNIDI